MFPLAEKWGIHCFLFLSTPNVVYDSPFCWVLFCRLAIIQLSTWSEVFILDMLALTDNVKDSEMQQFAENFFANPRVLKLGKYFLSVISFFQLGLYLSSTLRKTVGFKVKFEQRVVFGDLGICTSD